MSEKIRIVFMGTPMFAVHVLQRILSENFEVVAVVTVPDKPSGRGQKLHSSAVKDFAVTRNIPVLQPEKLKAPEFLKDLASFSADLFVVVAFRMLPKEVWQMPKLGTFNLHASLLPDYRGAAPINWAIINGEEKTGVATFFIDKKIDTGDIIDCLETDIDSDETAGELHDRLAALGSELVVQTIRKIASGTVQTKPQPAEDSQKAAPKLTLENTRIDWKRPSKEIHNLVRGLHPFPKAWSILVNNDAQMNAAILKTELTEQDISLEPGQIQTNKKEIFVGTADGIIQILTIQLPGKKPLKSADLLNGYRFDSNSRFI
jgi:methionyl-tRNA formyltransferase